MKLYRLILLSILAIILMGTHAQAANYERLYILPGQTFMAAGSTQHCRLAGIDAHGKPSIVTEKVTWSVGPEAGTITKDGLFTAGKKPGHYPFAVKASIEGGASTTLPVDIIDSKPLGGYVLDKWWPSCDVDAFDRVADIALDKDGNLVLLDIFRSRVIKLTRDGQYITTWGSKGNTRGQFDFQYNQGDSKWAGGVAVDSKGNIYVTDSGNNRVQKFTSDGKLISTWGSLGIDEGQLYAPAAVGIGKDDLVYVVDRGNHRIQKFTAEGKCVGEFGGFGSKDGQLRYPKDIAIDPKSETVYILDSGNKRVVKFDANGKYLGQFGKSGVGSGELQSPTSIFIDKNSNLYVVDYVPGKNGEVGRIQVFDSNGDLLCQSKSEDYMMHLYVVKCVTVDDAGNIYAGTWNDICKFDSKLQYIGYYRWGNAANMRLPGASNIVDGPGEKLYGLRDYELCTFDDQGDYISSVHLSVPESFKGGPYLLAVDPSGNAYCASDTGCYRFNSKGECLGEWPSRPRAFDSQGYGYAVNPKDHCVERFDPATGKIVASWKTPKPEDASWDDWPQQVTVAGDKVLVGADDEVTVLDLNGKQLKNWSYRGIACSTALSHHIVVDAKGYVYVTQGRGELLKFDMNGKFMGKWGPEVEHRLSEEPGYQYVEFNLLGAAPDGSILVENWHSFGEVYRYVPVKQPMK